MLRQQTLTETIWENLDQWLSSIWKSRAITFITVLSLFPGNNKRRKDVTSDTAPFLSISHLSCTQVPSLCLPHFPLIQPALKRSERRLSYFCALNPVVKNSYSEQNFSEHIKILYFFTMKRRMMMNFHCICFLESMGNTGFWF